MMMQEQKTVGLLAVFEVLKKNTDANNRLTSSEIFGMVNLNKEIVSKEEISELKKDKEKQFISKKTVERHLNTLLDMSYVRQDIISGYDVIKHEIKNKHGKVLRHEWHIIGGFTDAELRFLVDSLYSAKHIPTEHRAELIEKLKKQSNQHFHKMLKHVRVMPQSLPENKELLQNIEKLVKAIDEGRKVTFNCINYGLDKKLHLKEKDGSVRQYVANPYQIAVQNGRCYLICSHDNNDNKLTHYSLSIITNLKVLNKSLKPLSEVLKGSRNIDLKEYLSERVHMWTGEAVDVTFKACNSILYSIYDWFGLGVWITEEPDNKLIVQVRQNESDFLFWALQFGKYVEVLRPQSLRDKVTNAIKIMTKNYQIEPDGL